MHDFNIQIKFGAILTLYLLFISEQTINPFIKEDQRMEGIVSHLPSRLKAGCLDLGLEEASLGIHLFLLEKEIKQT